MKESDFWRIIEKAGAPDTCSPKAQCEIVINILSRLSKSDLIDFENIRYKLLSKIYTQPMLQACFIVLDYISDDKFEDFRHWIILNGEARYKSTLENPDNMAMFIKAKDSIEEISGEPLMFVVEEAWDGAIEAIEDEVDFPKTFDIPSDWPPKDKLQKKFPNLYKAFWKEKAA